MKQLAVISGKGGTGKTSVLGSLAMLARPAVTADCDVDAADLHLLLQPKIRREEPFSGGSEATIDTDLCTACGMCKQLCRFGAVRETVENKQFTIDKMACEGCGVCAYFCPSGAVRMEEADNGTWFVSDTRTGPLVHARLHPGSENSGKLVTLVRREATEIAKDRGLDLVLIDGSPGIGCPVIASVAGVDLALIVAEPTKSGIHDLDRVVRLIGHFDIPGMVAVNKYDINAELAFEIEETARAAGLRVAGRIRYDTGFIDAQVKGRSVVETVYCQAAEDIEKLWNEVRTHIELEERSHESRGT